MEEILGGIMMRRTKRICSLVTLIASLMFIACVAQAGTPVSPPFYDSFDSYTVGQHPDPYWQTLFNGTSAQVSDFTSAHWPRSDGKSLELKGSAGWARMEYIKLASLPDVLSYEATVYLGEGDIHVGFMWKDGPQGPMKDFFRFRNTGLITWEGVSGTNLGEWNPGDIYRVRADIDGPSQTADVYLFNVITGGWTYKLDVAALWPTSGDPHYILLDQFGISAGGLGAASSVYVDDVLIIPEPTTLLLLGLGGLALLRRKRGYGA
jgi:hypothetical protein